MSTGALNLLSVAPGVFAPVAGALTRARGAEATVREALNSTSADGHALPPEFVAAHVAAEAARMGTRGAYVGYLQAWRWFSIQFADPPRLEAMVRAVKAPAMVLHGALDRVVSPRSAHRLSELQPGWALRMIEGVGHNPNCEVPDHSARLILDWIDGVTTESR